MPAEHCPFFQTGSHAKHDAPDDLGPCHYPKIAQVDALLISHNHRDHARSMGIFQRQFGLPIHVTRPTLAAAHASMPLGDLAEVREFTAGSTLDFGAVQVETIPTPHDGVDGVAFVVDDGRSRLGILTDLGHVFSRLQQLIGTLDAVLLESNYDPGMLAGGPYPTLLKQRIAGTGGTPPPLPLARPAASCCGSGIDQRKHCGGSIENASRAIAQSGDVLLSITRSTRPRTLRRRRPGTSSR